MIQSHGRNVGIVGDSPTWETSTPESLGPATTKGWLSLKIEQLSVEDMLIKVGDVTGTS